MKLNCFFFHKIKEITIIHSVPYVVLNGYVVVLLFILTKHRQHFYIVFQYHIICLWNTYPVVYKQIYPSLRNFHRLIRTCLLAGLVWFLLPVDKENHCKCYGVQLSEDMRKIMRAVLTILGGLFFLGLSLHGAGSVFAAEWSSTS